MTDKKQLIQQYFQKVKASNKELTKKEAFKDLLNRLYSSDKEIQEIIDKITLGAEATIVNIPKKDKLRRGSADTLYNNIIIEFENDLKVTYKHAKEQLAGYLLGQFKSGVGYNFTLIASDFINWKVVAPDINCLDKLDNLQEHELILNEVESASFTLTESNTEEFYYWIDRFLFKEEKQKATLKRIKESFGNQSNVFIESIRELIRHFNDVKKYNEVQVSFEQWKKFLSIAYGSFDVSENNFLIHTYLSVFSKMLAYAVLSNDDYIDEYELKGIINGSIFNKYNIQNFIDNDFFHWINRDFRGLKKVFRLIAQEISSYDFNKVDEDILKGVYQELIDLDTRHALGEYYTPDWLCERVVKEFQFKATNRILDPACGSGSFLRAAIHRIKELNPKISVEEINNNIYGIDIHPLSVQIAKTTLLLALGKEITKAKKPIYLNIILANTLLSPIEVKNIFGGEFIMNIDKEKLWLNTQVFENVHLFDEALEVCEDLAEQTMHKEKEKQQTFENHLKRRYKVGGFNPQVIDSFYQIYETLKLVKEKGRDNIWKFIVQNLYKPYFLNKKFDYVIGNPPWFTYSSIKNEDYQNQLNSLAEKYDVKPSRVANFTNLEIAAIFLSHCCNYFLKEDGQLCFVLPRSFFSADHHDNTRSGKAKGFRLTQVWDLKEVAPLFRIPSSVFFAEKAVVKRFIPETGLTGITFSGNLPSHNCNWSTAKTNLSEQVVKWYYNKQGKSSALLNRKLKVEKRTNQYKEHFKQGATIIPRAFFFVELDQNIPPDWEERIINVKTANSIKADAKPPWSSLELSGQIESEFLFRTSIGRNVFPFTLYNPDLVVLPISISTDNNGYKKINLLTTKELTSEGYSYAAKWFRNVDNYWSIYRTEKNKKISAADYLNWQNKLTEHNLDDRYMVLYNGRGSDVSATVVDRTQLDLEFIVDHALYWICFKDAKEAFYLSAILNSSIPNEMIKEFQSSGLFGARNIHKKILDVFYPKFDEKDSLHTQLCEVSKQAHEKATAYMKKNPPHQELSAIVLGRTRVEIRNHLAKELREIDKLVKKIIG